MNANFSLFFAFIKQNTTENSRHCSYETGEYQSFGPLYNFVDFLISDVRLCWIFRLV